MDKSEVQKLGEEYSQIADKIKLGSANYEYIADFIINKSKVSPGFKILEAGCGNGFLGKILSEKIIGIQTSLFAFDVAPKLVDNARKLNKSIQYKVMALPETDYLEIEFDIIICSEVLEHLSKPLASIFELRRILKDQGSLIITIP